MSEKTPEVQTCAFIRDFILTKLNADIFTSVGQFDGRPICFIFAGFILCRDVYYFIFVDLYFNKYILPSADLCVQTHYDLCYVVKKYEIIESL